MRIWIINHYACSPAEPGGTRHHSLARELINRGHDVTIFASSFVHYEERQRLEAKEKWIPQRVEEVPFVWVRSPRYRGNGPARIWNMLVFGARTSKLPRSVAGSAPDVVIGSSPHLFAAYAAMRLAFRYRAAFVLEVRDLWPDTLVELGNLGKNHPVVRFLEVLERLLYRRANMILSLPPAAGARMESKGADKDAIRWLPNGVDLRMVPHVSQPPAKAKVTGIYAGAHGQANMLDALLDAALLLEQEGWANKVEIQLLGEGPEKARLQDRATREGISIVRFLDAVPKAEVYRILECADFGIHMLKNSPLWQWGISPNKLFDYMAVARPVILTTESPMNPVSMAGAGITVQPENSRSLAEAIKQMAGASASERWEIGRRGRNYVVQNHSLHSLAQKLESYLTEDLSKVVPGGRNFEPA